MISWNPLYIITVNVSVSYEILLPLFIHIDAVIISLILVSKYINGSQETKIKVHKLHVCYKLKFLVSTIKTCHVIKIYTRFL